MRSVPPLRSAGARASNSLVTRRPADCHGDQSRHGTRQPPASQYLILESGSEPRGVRLSEILAGLSYALDLTEGQRPGHCVRSCLIGMQIATALSVPDEERSALFYALLLKDLGCSSNAARFAALFGGNDQDLKAALKYIDWSRALDSFGFIVRRAAPERPLLSRVWHLLGLLVRAPSGAREVVRTRCERGADIARILGLPDATVDAIRALDEHWDGHGQPYRLAGQSIPPLARILSLAQTVEVFASAYGVDAAFDMARTRRGTWFDPLMVDALTKGGRHAGVWGRMDSVDGLAALQQVEPPDRILVADDAQVDAIAAAFARVIDAKSPWTYRHSTGVA